MRIRMRLVHIFRRNGQPEGYRFQAVDDQEIPVNKRFQVATANGELDVTSDRLGYLKMGQEFYVTLHHAEGGGVVEVEPEDQSGEKKTEEAAPA